MSEKEWVYISTPQSKIEKLIREIFESKLNEVGYFKDIKAFRWYNLLRYSTVWNFPLTRNDTAL